MKIERTDHIVPRSTTFSITDDAGHTVTLNPEQAYELLDWLYQRRDELRHAVNFPDEPETDTYNVSSPQERYGKQDGSDLDVG